MCEEMIESNFIDVAILIGEKSRARILWSLMDGRAYTNLELATIGGLSKQACSNHLQKLLENDIISVNNQGRHRYFFIKNVEVAKALENLAAISTSASLNVNQSTIASGIMLARSCYDHLAGRLSVLLKEGLLKNQLITECQNTYEVSELGIKWFETKGIRIDRLKSSKRKFAYGCMDWSERKVHIAGALGAALLQFMFEDDWLRRKHNTREVLLTSKGRMKLYDELLIRLDR